MTIRQATIEDSEVIFDIANAAFSPSPWPKSVFENELQSSNHRYFIMNGGFIGIAQVLDEVEISSVAVHPNYQHQGIAKCLLLHVFSLPNVERFLLEVDEANRVALSLYEKLGFQAYFRREKYYRNGHAAIMMERNKSQ